MQEQPRRSLALSRMESNSSQQEVRVEFTEDTERADTDGVSGKLGKERESHLCAGSGVFTEDGGLVYLSSQGSRNWSEQR